jgi:hypothetical protein
MLRYSLLGECKIPSACTKPAYRLALYNSESLTRLLRPGVARFSFAVLAFGNGYYDYTHSGQNTRSTMQKHYLWMNITVWNLFPPLKEETSVEGASQYGAEETVLLSETEVLAVTEGWRRLHKGGFDIGIVKANFVVEEAMRAQRAVEV